MIPMLPSCHSSLKNVQVLDQPVPIATRLLAFWKGHTNATKCAPCRRPTRGGMIELRYNFPDVAREQPIVTTLPYLTPNQFMQSTVSPGVRHYDKYLSFRPT